MSTQSNEILLTDPEVVALGRERMLEVIGPAVDAVIGATRKSESTVTSVAMAPGVQLESVPQALARENDAAAGGLDAKGASRVASELSTVSDKEASLGQNASVGTTSVQSAGQQGQSQEERLEVARRLVDAA